MGIKNVLANEPCENRNVLDTFSAMGVQPASGKMQGEKLPSGINYLDEFLDGGLPLGAVTEWGVPLGRGGRAIVLSFLAGITGKSQSTVSGEKPQWALWAYSRPQLMVYPPAWLARGVSLAHMRFAYAPKPVAELKPVFLDPWFRVIVLDAPQGFSDEDCAFIAKTARENNQSILLLRDFFLGSRRGNVWAKLRINSWQDHADGQFHLKVVRGLSPRELNVNLEEWDTTK